jgi:hypothetical protein
MRTRLLVVFCTLQALALGVACNGLRSGPLDETPTPATSDGGDGTEGGGGASSGSSNGGDGGANNSSDAGAIDADIDPEWAMSPLPVPNPPANNYAVADGVVRDEVTGLAWMQNTLSAQPQASAATACAAITLQGGNWRLPTRTELLSITDYSSKGINQDVFGSSLEDGTFWTSTPDSASSTHAWMVRFGVSAAITDDRNATKNVRCVRGPALSLKTKPGAPRGHYILSSQFVAYDVRTRLEWMREPAKPTAINLEGALNACANLSLEGTKWRLPNARELETLFDVRAVTSPAWDIEVFGNPASTGLIFWTLTTLSNLPQPYTHLGVDFRPSMSTTTLASATSLAFVRCVRGPK